MPEGRHELEKQLADMAADTRAGGALAALDQIDQVRCLLADGAAPEALILAAIRMTQTVEAMHQSAYLRDIQRGRRILQAAREGAAAAHGAPEDRQALYTAYQDTVNELYAKNPHLSWTALTDRAGKVHGCAGKTIRRHTRRPKENGTLPGTVPNRLA